MMNLTLVTLLGGLTVFTGTQEKFPTRNQVESFIKNGVKVYQRAAPGTSILHISVRVGEGFTRLELIAAESDGSFYAKRYHQIRPYKNGFLLIESNKPDWFGQEAAQRSVYRKQIISRLKLEEQLVYADSTITEMRHMLYEPRRLFLHYDGSKLTIKEWLTD